MNFKLHQAALPVRFRPTTEADEGFLSLLHAAIHGPDFALAGLDAHALNAILTMQYSARKREYTDLYPNSLHQIILLQDQPVGRLWTHAAPDHIELLDIAVLPEAQGRGIGSAVINSLLTAAASEGKPVYLTVLQTNAAAQHLYVRLGFRVTEEQPPHLRMAWTPPAAIKSGG